MRIKDIILTGVCVFSFLTPAAQETKKCLVLLKNDDSTVYFPLADEPKIKFQVGDNWGIYEYMTIESDAEQLSVWLPEQDKLEVYEVSGVKSIADDGKSEMSIVGKEIIVEAVVSNISFSIANLNGQIITAGELPIGLSTISLSGYQSGVYIITIDKKSFKIHIK